MRACVYVCVRACMCACECASVTVNESDGGWLKTNPLLVQRAHVYWTLFAAHQARKANPVMSFTSSQRHSPLRSVYRWPARSETCSAWFLFQIRHQKYKPCVDARAVFVYPPAHTPTRTDTHIRAILIARLVDMLVDDCARPVFRAALLQLVLVAWR